MKILVVSLALCLWQMVTLQDKPVVYLAPHHLGIDPTVGGKLLELENAPGTLTLPMVPPKSDAAGAPWEVDIKNLGPRAVKILGKNGFSISIRVGQTVHVASNGSIYRLAPQ